MINPSDTDTAQGGTAVLPPPAAEAATQGAHESVRGRASANRFTIPGDKINAATAHLPEDQREAIRWAAGYCRAKNLHPAEFAAELKKPNGEPYSRDSVLHMFGGTRSDTSLAPMVEAIERLRRVEDERADLERAPFVLTRLAKRIFALCRRAFLRQKMVFIFGDSQIGKTSALEEYSRRNNHGETKYVRMPAGGSHDNFVFELAKVLGIPTSNRANDLRARILASFDSRMLLIVDECEETLTDRTNSTKGEKTLNFIREIHDRCKCGIVLAGANIFRRRLYLGGQAGSMQRLVRRGMPPLQLPNVPGQADLATFAAHFGLPTAPAEVIGVRVTEVDDDGNERRTPVEQSPLELQNKIVREHGLGRWLMILTEASDTAKERRKPISWGYVIHAWHTFTTGEQIAPDQKEAA